MASPGSGQGVGEKRFREFGLTWGNQGIPKRRYATPKFPVHVHFLGLLRNAPGSLALRSPAEHPWFFGCASNLEWFAVPLPGMQGNSLLILYSKFSTVPEPGLQGLQLCTAGLKAHHNARSTQSPPLALSGTLRSQGAQTEHALRTFSRHQEDPGASNAMRFNSNWS